MELQDRYIETLNELVAYQTGEVKKVGDESQQASAGAYP